MNLTSDLRDHIATAREDGSDAARLVLADHLREAGDEDRADLIRVQCERGLMERHREPKFWSEMDAKHAADGTVCPCFRCGLKRRERELTTRNPAWLSVPCPEGHVYDHRLMNTNPTLTRGFLTVTLPSALCWREGCDVCGGYNGSHVPSCKNSADRDCCRPHPVLAAILASPVGIWVEAVRVSDKKPFFDARYHLWFRQHPSGAPVIALGHADLPVSVFDGLPHEDEEEKRTGVAIYPTTDAATDALARAVPRWARARLGDAR